MTSNSTKETSAKCTFEFTPELFEEYVCISDFMSKWKKFGGQCLMLLFCITILILITIFVPLALQYSIVAIGVFTLLLAIDLTALITQKPPLWNLGNKKSWLSDLYLKWFGLAPNMQIFECVFTLNENVISFSTPNKAILTSLNNVRWVRRKDNLIVFGCLDDSRSMTSDWINFNVNFYKAIPAVAFLIDKLEGMDAEELIALLEVHAKQHQKDYFWKWQPISGPM